jgi:hypothetical protein
MSTAAKQFVANVRAYKEKLEAKHSRPYAGGREILISSEEVHKQISDKFGIVPSHEVSRYFTYSRSCTHPWSAGACKDCPEVDHLRIPL